MVVVGSVALVRICVAPLDVSGTTATPAYVTTAKGNDQFAYSAHLGLATLLEAFHCSPTATGLQWLKAGAHARSPAEVSRTAHGLATARQRSGAGEPLESSLCGFLRGGFVSSGQAAAMVQADIRCPGLTEAPP
jgi:hypothetical protein